MLGGDKGRFSEYIVWLVESCFIISSMPCGSEG
jgi:hypothetical protein